MIQIPIAPEYTEFLHKKASAARIPLSASFELTPMCNLSCRMCYVRMDKADMEKLGHLRPASEWIRLAEEGKEQGLLFILLTGGEPFTHPEFRQILSGLQERGFIVSINSNATLIDEETVSWLKETPPARINITLYGASEDSYEKLCGNGKAYTKAVNAIHLLREAGIDVKINVSVTPYNAADLEAILAFCEKEKLVAQATSYMFPPLRRDASSIGSNDRFSPEEAAWYAAKIESLLSGEEEFIRKARSGSLEELKMDALDDCETDANDPDSDPLKTDPASVSISETAQKEPAEKADLPREGLHCRAGKCTGWITWDGKMLACGMIPNKTASDVFKEGFQASWKKVVEETAAIRLPASCTSCRLKETCRPCAAMVYTESGNFDDVPLYRCRMAHAYPDQVLKLVEELEKNR